MVAAMKGLRLMRLLDVLPVTGARNADGIMPRSLIVSCPDLRAVDQVLINGMSSPSFAVYSKTELIAEVPEPLEDAIVTDVAVLSSVPSYTQRSLVELGVGARVAIARGSQRLLQTFIRMLLRTGGSNIFHPELGAGLGNAVGATLSKHARADVAVAIGMVKTQIIAAQSPYTNIPASERLLSAEIAALHEDAQTSTIYVTVVLTTHDRQRNAATFLS